MTSRAWLFADCCFLLGLADVGAPDWPCFQSGSEGGSAKSSIAGRCQQATRSNGKWGLRA